MRVHQQPAYVLLNRPYSESSWIVEVFSRDYGRLALMAKGARRIKSRLKGVLLPFQPVLLSWVGKGAIPTLTSAEIQPSELNLIEHELTGERLVCGFYCNELIVYLLHRHDPHIKLFNDYHHTILSLHKAKFASRNLREFEQKIIKEIGYAVNFKFEADGKTRITSDSHYQFLPGQGFVSVPSDHKKATSGRVIIGLQTGSSIDFYPADNSPGKQLMRDILNQTLGYKKINSRELFYAGGKQFN